MKRILSIIVFAVCVIGICVDAQSPDISGIFPDIKNVPKSGEPLIFSPEALDEYINGAADIYLQYDVQELAVQEYANEDGAFVIIEMYRYGSALDAFGIYSQELPLEGNFLKIGAQGCSEDGLLIFSKGQYYVKLNSSGLGEKEQSTLTALAEELAGKLDGPTEFPAELEYFPPADKVPHSEQYLAQNVLGYPFLTHAFVTNYVVDEQGFQLFLIVADTPDACERMLKEYAVEVGDDPNSITEGSIVFSDGYHGTVELRWQGRYLWGVKGLEEPKDRDKALDQLEKRLRPLWQG